jgi:hypothetical protein
MHQAATTKAAAAEVVLLNQGIVGKTDHNVRLADQSRIADVAEVIAS